MSFQEFRYILAIAEHKNLTKAAQELFVSQPTLTKHLQKLEQQIGGKIFDRNGNSFSLTYLGRRYVEHANQMLSLNQTWEKELLDIKGSKIGELNIAFPLMRSSCIVPQIMDQFYKRYPEITLNFLEEAHAIQERLLLDDKIDFAVFNETALNPKLEFETLANEEILLLIPDHHPAKEKAVSSSNHRHLWMDLDFVKDEPFILHFPEQTTGRIALQLFDQYDIHPPVRIHTRSAETAVKLCSHGHGLCFVPESYIKNMELHHKPAAFSVGESGIYSKLILAYKKGTYLTSYAREFISIIKQSL